MRLVLWTLNVPFLNLVLSALSVLVVGLRITTGGAVLIKFIRYRVSPLLLDLDYGMVGATRLLGICIYIYICMRYGFSWL